MQNTTYRKVRARRNSSSLAVFGLLAIAFFIIGFARVSASIPTVREYSESQVLGDSIENKEEEEQKELEEKQDEAAKKEQEREMENLKKSEETQNTTSQRKETEIETASGLKVKTKIEDDGTRKMEIEKGKLKIKAETRTQKNSSPGGELREVENEVENEMEVDDDVLQIATDSGKSSLMRRNVKANSDFPLSIDPTTNTLQVTTPTGTKAVTVLPDQAVENLLRLGFVSSSDASSSAVASASSQVRLTEKDGLTVYEVRARKKFNFLGVFPIETPTTVTVSAQDGQVISQERSLLSEIVDWFSP